MDKENGMIFQNNWKWNITFKIEQENSVDNDGSISILRVIDYHLYLHRMIKNFWNCSNSTEPNGAYLPNNSMAGKANIIQRW